MASGDSLLLQALSKKKGDYLAENPYYRAGAQLSQQPVAAPQSNLQALLLPLLQGASTGLLTGYGKQQANQAEIADKNSLFNSISGRDFSPEEALSGETATLSLLNALQEKQDRQSLAAIEAANKAKLANTLAGKFMGVTPDGGIGLLYGAPEALQQKAEIEAKAKAGNKPQKDFFESLTALEKQVARLVPRFADKLEEIAGEYEALGKDQGVMGYQFKSLISGTKANDLNSRVKLLLPKVIKLLGQSGNLNEQEQVRALESSLGNLTSDPTDISKRIKDTSSLLRDVSIGVLESAKTTKEQGGQGLIDAMQQKTTPALLPYTREQLLSEGYSGEEIADFVAQGKVK